MNNPIILSVFCLLGLNFSALAQNNKERPTYSMYKESGKGNVYDTTHTTVNQKYKKVSVSMYKNSAVSISDDTTSSSLQNKKEQYTNLRRDEKSKGKK